MRKLFQLLFIALFISLSSFVSAEQTSDDDAILDAESAVVDVVISSALNVVPRGGDYMLSEVEVKSFLFPRDSFYQSVSNFKTQPRDYKIENDTLILEWDRPSVMEIPYSISATVETDGRHIPVKRRVDFPIDPNVLGSDVSQYVYPTVHIDSDHPDVEELAAAFSEDVDDLYELVFSIATWVNSNIDYNLSTLSEDVSKTSSWVLQNRRGVCAEMTSLFIALLRANGVPARYVSGVAYTNSPLFDFNWGPHGWADVFFPGYGWIPFDVTYGEYGYLDPSHIELRKTADSGEPSSYYGWYGYNVDIVAEEFDISPTIESMSMPSDDDVEVVAAPYVDVVSFGSYNAIEATVQNMRSYYLPAMVSITGANNIEIHSDNPQFILLQPGETRKLMWTVSVSPNLAGGYQYTFPFSIHSNQKQYTTTSFSARASAGVSYSKSDMERLVQVKEKEFHKTYSNNVRFVCDFEKRFYYPGESQKLVCEITNLGDESLSDLELCLHEKDEKTCKSLDLSPVQRRLVEIVPYDISLGERKLVVSLENEDVVKEDEVTQIVKQIPEVIIDDIEYPRQVAFGEEYQLEFLVEGVNTPRDLKINVRVNSLSRTWRVDELSINREFVLSLDSRDLYPNDNNEIVIKVVYNDDNAETYSITEEYKIELIDMPFLSKLYLYPKMWLEKLISLG